MDDLDDDAQPNLEWHFYVEPSVVRAAAAIGELTRAGYSARDAAQPPDRKCTIGAPKVCSRSGSLGEGVLEDGARVVVGLDVAQVAGDLA